MLPLHQRTIIGLASRLGSYNPATPNKALAYGGLALPDVPHVGFEPTTFELEARRSVH